MSAPYSQIGAKLAELIDGDDKREVAPSAIRNFVKQNRKELLAALCGPSDDARDAARYRRLRENYITCDELNFRGRLAWIDKNVDAAIASDATPEGGK